MPQALRKESLNMLVFCLLQPQNVFELLRSNGYSEGFFVWGQKWWQFNALYMARR